MSAFTTPGNYGYSINGQLSSHDISCNLITNANKNKIQFINLGGTRGSIFIGQKLLHVSNKTEIPVLKVTLLQGSSYGGCHCEFIICGTHNNIDGFLIKYEFLLNQNNTEAKIFSLSVESASDIPGTTIGWFQGPGYMILPKLTHTNTGSGLNSYKTFSVVPAQTGNVQLNQSLDGRYTMFFRMSHGGVHTFTYEIL